MTPFHIGQKVTMIRPIAWFTVKREVAPEFGVVYTVRAMPRAALLFEEIVNRPMRTESGFHERGFKAYRFRPALARPTDLSIFEWMLHQTPEDLMQFAIDENIRALMIERGLLLPPEPPGGQHEKGSRRSVGR